MKLESRAMYSYKSGDRCYRNKSHGHTQIKYDREFKQEKRTSEYEIKGRIRCKHDLDGWCNEETLDQLYKENVSWKKFPKKTQYGWRKPKKNY